jgi:hypothetical protein
MQPEVQGLSDEAAGLVVTRKLNTIVTGYRCRYTHDRSLIGCWAGNYLMQEGNVSFMTVEYP